MDRTNQDTNLYSLSATGQTEGQLTHFGFETAGSSEHRRDK